MGAWWDSGSYSNLQLNWVHGDEQESNGPKVWPYKSYTEKGIKS